MTTGKFIPIDYLPKILSGFPYGIVICNADGKFIYWNKEAIQILKTTKLDIPQDSWVNEFGIFSLDKSRKLDIEELPMTLALKGVVSIKNIYLQNEENPEGIFLKIKGYPIHDVDEGRVHLGVIIIEDITEEQKKFEDFLQTINDLSDFIKGQLREEAFSTQEKLNEAIRKYNQK